MEMRYQGKGWQPHRRQLLSPKVLSHQGLILDGQAMKFVCHFKTKILWEMQPPQ